MIALRLAPAVLSLLVLAAHFYRGQAFFALAAALATLALVFVRKPWAPRIIQIALLLGAVEWIRTLYSLVQVRESMGQPYTRLALILGGVALFSALSCLAFQRRDVRSHYAGSPPHEAK
jgi:prepilin signal peptidase PulO-like enzyme (type II secretory pathway)